MVPSTYATSTSARDHGLNIIMWTLERTEPGLDGWYWRSLADVEGGLSDGDVRVLGVFLDWPATTTFFVNCMELGMRRAGDVDVDADESSTTGDGGSDVDVDSSSTGDGGGDMEVESSVLSI